MTTDHAPTQPCGYGHGPEPTTGAPSWEAYGLTAEQECRMRAAAIVYPECADNALLKDVYEAVDIMAGYIRTGARP